MIRGRNLSDWKFATRPPCPPSERCWHPAPTGLGAMRLSASEFNSPVGFIAAAAVISIGLVFALRSSVFKGLDDHDIDACDDINGRIQRTQRQIDEAHRQSAGAVKINRLANRLESYRRTRRTMDC